MDRFLSENKDLPEDRLHTFFIRIGFLIKVKRTWLSGSGSADKTPSQLWHILGKSQLDPSGKAAVRGVGRLSVLLFLS